jgi:pimeloyl-ACP methyl ester carboxylesterase
MTSTTRASDGAKSLLSTSQVVDSLVAAANADGELQLNSANWSGTVSLVCDEVTRDVAVQAGRFAAAASGQAQAAEGDAVVIGGTSDAWDKLLLPVPPPGFTDVFSAAYSGITVAPPPRDAARHLAIRRLVELLRHTANGTDPVPRGLDESRPHGSHDAAIGRYVHLDLDGVSHRVYYEEAGTGIPLLCQHTAGSDGRQWRHLLEDERITSRFRLISYDLPYHGKSLPPNAVAWWSQPYRLTRDFLMQVPLALADALGLDRPAFIGSSVGGMLALDLGRYHPDSFRAVIACEGALHLGVDDPGSAESEAADEDAVKADGLGEDPALHAASMMSWMSVTAPEAYRQETRFHYAQGAPGVFPGDIHYFGGDHDLRGEAHLLNVPRCPVYMLTGDYDVVTVPFSEQAAKEIPGVQLEMMHGLGHFPMSEDPARFTRYLLPILDRIAAS